MEYHKGMFKDWISSITSDSIRAVAKQAEITHRTLAYQLEKEQVTPENVIAIALAYDVHPVGALVETGYLDEKWGEQIDPKLALRIVSEEDLCDEVLRRMKIPGMIQFLDQPVDELARRRYVRILQDELARVTYNENHMPDDAVAYSGPDEDQMRAAQEDDDHIP